MSHIWGSGFAGLGTIRTKELHVNKDHKMRGVVPMFVVGHEWCLLRIEILHTCRGWMVV